MKEISFDSIKYNVVQILYPALYDLNCFTLHKLYKAYSSETSERGKYILDAIINNALTAREESIPMCQDTGVTVCFVKLGYDVHLNCDLYEAINAGVREAYEKYYLRKSVADPLTRINTRDNTPAIIHVEMVKGDNLTIKIAPKGAGSENMSKLKMLSPTAGKEGIVEYVLSVIKEAGGNPCPPIFVGVGIGGDFEKCALMAKEALLRETRSEDPLVSNLEEELFKKINELKIGPMGLGGDNTCLDVFINTAPCHIASLPVAVNIQCHANRHVEVTL